MTNDEKKIYDRNIYIKANPIKSLLNVSCKDLEES